jgi:uncharacterized protein YgbK (DUF1537 family)
MEAFESAFVPVLAAAPDLGRFCVFGSLFARCGSESEPYRLDRHPSMSRHPVTPMNEADLRLHLAKQTRKAIGLLDVLQLQRPKVRERFDAIVAGGAPVVLIDALDANHLRVIGELLVDKANDRQPLFVVGSSGVESALCARWKEVGAIAGDASFAVPTYAGPIVALCGSCSPVTARQIAWAVDHGFVEVALSVQDLLATAMSERVAGDAVTTAASAIARGRSVIIHTRGEEATDLGAADRHRMGAILGGMLRRLLDTAAVRRVLVAGGDTSSQVARAIGIHAVEMIGELTRGSPLCRASAPDSPADKIEITFKGGQIGPVDFFGNVERKQAR